jgi:ankyrin repeat protein
LYIGCKESIESLLLAKVDINVKADGYTPLHIAIQANMLESVLFLLRNGADEDITTSKGQNALELAFSCNAHHNIIKLLTGEIPLPPLLTLSQISKFFGLLNEGKLDQCEKLMSQNIEYVVTPSENGCNGLDVSICIENLDSVKLFIAHGASCVSITNGNKTLHYAIASCNDEIFDYLISIGAAHFSDTVYLREATPLDLAVFTGTHKGIAALQRNGIKPPKTSPFYQFHVLQLCALSGKADGLRYLLELYGPDDIDVNERDCRGYTALHYAAEYGRVLCIGMCFASCLCLC